MQTWVKSTALTFWGKCLPGIMMNKHDPHVTPGSPSVSIWCCSRSQPGCKNALGESTRPLRSLRKEQGNAWPALTSCAPCHGSVGSPQPHGYSESLDSCLLLRLSPHGQRETTVHSPAVVLPVHSQRVNDSSSLKSGPWVTRATQTANAHQEPHAHPEHLAGAQTALPTSLLHILSAW